MAAQPHLAVSRNTLPIPYSIHLLPGEKLVMVIHSSRVLLYWELRPNCGLIPRGAGAGACLMLIVAVALYWPEVWVIGIIAVVMIFALVGMLIRLLNYKYNICILTNRRIINIERSHLLIEEKRTETEYDNIREVNVHIPYNLFRRLFHIGEVHIETLSTSADDICLSSVDYPFAIQERIYRLRDRFIQ